MTKDEAIAMLTFSLEVEKAYYGDRSALEFLSEHIFDFTTYDSAMSELFACKALEVASAISDRTTFEYIKDGERHQWFLIMCNMPFFYPKLEWGTSIRGAWWDSRNPVEISSCGLWIGDEQVLTLTLNAEEWNDFIKAMIEFAEDKP
jgi:hypothetical protein